jgi:arylsulfatase A-like enzyme
VGSEYLPHEALFIERNDHGGWDPMRAVRTPRYHYIRNFGAPPRRPWTTNASLKYNIFAAWYSRWQPEPGDPRPAEELFDIENDPQEYINLADKPAYADIKSELAVRLDEWMKSTADPLLAGRPSGVIHSWPSSNHRVDRR